MAGLPAEIQRGIFIHREIDRLTDTHPVVKKSVRLFQPSQKKYSPVVVDIAYDYFLTKHWGNFHNAEIQEFADKTYSILDQYKGYYPGKLQSILPKMLQDNFLLSCANETRIRKTFERVSKRATFENEIHRAFDDLQSSEGELEEHFHNFFPELIQAVECFSQKQYK